MAIQIGINGFGRIGRVAFRIAKNSKFCNKCGARVDKNKVAANEAMAEAEAHQMDGTKEEEQEAQYVVNEIENASADIIMDIVNH